MCIRDRRRGDRRVQDFDFMAQNFDLAACHVGVDRAGRPGAHFTGDLEAELIADRFSDLEHFGSVRVANNLSNTFAVAQVDEDDSTVVTPTVGQAAERNFLADDF